MTSIKLLSLLTSRALDSLPLPLLVIIFVACLVLLHCPASPTPSLLPLYTPPPSLSSSPSIFEKGNNRLSSLFFSFPASHSSTTNHPRGTDPFSFPRSLPAGSPSFPHTSLPASSSSSQLYSHSRLPLVFSFPLGETTTWICAEQPYHSQQKVAAAATAKTKLSSGKEKQTGGSNNGSHGKRKRGSKSLGLKEWRLQLGVVSEEAEAEVDVDINGRVPVEMGSVLKV
ncbi:hypothetical protein C351_05531 [Cryptococcus neoformans c8]|nr:hypothetical protein C353_05684 [Cryptococcus neoformans var. grubii AD1-83a]OXG51000.1 hypothetical protein C354_05626 [Cryptococcus neoformans var. grubii MW-RSA1955]OXG55197.1 hypothetical protein C352_05607 [Cryptococcus neoformans var. grubii CHC193]OXG59242.1 hypothetical protein C351_05531 [Cryptococcus neoformans var. grubii c8]OXH04208.1 hypothetical protein C369_05812 [Cryptococcus neoformans var. grubii A5-35-17]OXH05516.1 hypothetical protein C370_05894 [Cryptococcus neoformans 